MAGCRGPLFAEMRMLNTSRAEATVGSAVPRWKFIYAGLLLVVVYLLVCLGSWFFGAHRCDGVAATFNQDVTIDRERSWFPPGVICVLSDEAGQVIKRDFGIWGTR